ncbi:hypothetical protein [Bradyrhizobium sp. CCBAU 25338]|uniref:hypothetical protein n=1 Tax=Bradyrhizobium sp. CCBAU 25338 TaxID=1641877 RepID=UPI0023028601|nr:hypothetical protein [Bradyrhizobium sp. CCBAU 25338]MDA9529895.1 hypothetical protein [Bradyrhizobium sp. CCBAU 25338]
MVRLPIAVCAFHLMTLASNAGRFDHYDLEGPDPQEVHEDEECVVISRALIDLQSITAGSLKREQAIDKAIGLLDEADNDCIDQRRQEKSRR